MAAYATADDLFARYDTDLIRRFASDSNVELSAADARNHVNVSTALTTASGRVEAALLHGKRYTVADLGTLTDNSLAWLVDLVCLVAMNRLLGRRPGTHEPERENMAKREKEYLDLLSSGHDVFNLTAQVDAGLMTHEHVSEATLINRKLRTDALKGHLLASE